MEIYIPIFIVIIVTTSQANQMRLYPQIIARQGALMANSGMLSKLGPYISWDSLINNSTHLVKEYEAAQYQAPYPTLQTRGILEGAARKDDETEQKAEFDEIDNVALSMLSEHDRQLILSKFSKATREALLTKLEDVHLEDALSMDENRFGLLGGFTATAAQIGSSAGGYIGGKLGGPIGAKIGAAAGAYICAAAVSQLRSSGGYLFNKNPTGQNNIHYGYDGTHGDLVIKYN